MAPPAAGDRYFVEDALHRHVGGDAFELELWSDRDSMPQRGHGERLDVVGNDVFATVGERRCLRQFQ